LSPGVKAKSKLLGLEGSEHEVFIERDAIRTRAFDEMERFMETL